MRIVVDLQGAQTESRFRGIGRYCLSLTKAMVRQAGDHELWIALNSSLQDTIDPLFREFDGLIPRNRIVVFDLPGPLAERNSSNLWRTHVSELVREHFLSSLAPDFTLVTSLFEGFLDDAATSMSLVNPIGLNAVILYDLIPLLNTDSHLFDERHRRWYFRKLESLKRADLLMAISEHSRQEAIAKLGLPCDRVVNIKAAADERFRFISRSAERKRETLQALGIQKPFVMYTGGFDEHKNLKALIEAFSFLPVNLRSRYQLVLVGKVPIRKHETLSIFSSKLGLNSDSVIFPGYVADEDLVVLYNECDLFILPSLHEGFGLPALEAMACGAPVIASNVTSIPEVVGLSDALFDPTRPQSIADSMARVLNDPSFAATLRENGPEQAKKFSWDISARVALAALQDRYRNPRETGPDRNGRGTAKAVTKRQPRQLLIDSIARIDTSVRPTSHDLLATAISVATNERVTMQPQLLVDVSELVVRDAKTGIQRVTRSVILELFKNPPSGFDVQLVYFDGSRFRYARQFTRTLRIGQGTLLIEDDAVLAGNGDIFLGLDLSAHCIQSTEDIIRKMSRLGVRIYFVIYDLLPILKPDTYPPGMNEMFSAWMRIIAGVADGVICISRSVADEVLQAVKRIPPQRWRNIGIGYFHLGADVSAQPATATINSDIQPLLGNIRTRPSFLMVGTLEPRKGHSQALAAIELVWGEGHDINLVIVGKQGWMVDAVAERIRSHREIGKRLFWLEKAGDDILSMLYAECTVLLMASEGEGFGLPLVEAAQQNLPIIARDLPVFREIAGEHAFYFSGLKPENLAQALKEWLRFFDKDNHPRSDDMPWLTWEQSTAQLLRVILNNEWSYRWEPTDR